MEQNSRAPDDQTSWSWQAAQTHSGTDAPFQGNPTNYRFVDEQTGFRPWRGAAAKACQKCRSSKVKCDGITTRNWPCSACRRLNYPCVPPAEAYRQGASLSNDGTPLGIVEYLPPMPIAGQNFRFEQTPSDHGSSSSATSQHVYLGTAYGGIPSPSALPLLESPVNKERDSGRSELANALSELYINDAGTAAYISDNKKTEADPLFGDLRSYMYVSGSANDDEYRIHIPPEMIPPEDVILSYIELFFTHIHPYVPVLDRTVFYEQWHTNRDSISPLILEAIMAIAYQAAGHVEQGKKWLALFNEHLDAFLDASRLSTLQAMLLILKAREAEPVRGYYYRSWTMVNMCVAMAKDLRLHKHCEEHARGLTCAASSNDCTIKTRVWQTLYVCEVLICTAQGRTDMSVDQDTLNLNVPIPLPESRDAALEYQISRNFRYFVKTVRNIGRMSNIYAGINTAKDWAIHPALGALRRPFIDWQNDLPEELQIEYPADGSPPWITSHFVANMHAYYQLSIIVLYRPRLRHSVPGAADGKWMHDMMICYDAAKRLCKLQEAVLREFGIMGLLSMQRGVNFSIYCVLYCVMLHLVAMTSPDPALNSDAPEYFSRHMRLLETCSAAWSMPTRQRQVDALREAFSVDISKPFVLKRTIPDPILNAMINDSTTQTPAERRDNIEQLLTSQNQSSETQGNVPQQDYSLVPDTLVDSSGTAISTPYGSGFSPTGQPIESLIKSATVEWAQSQLMEHTTEGADINAIWNPFQIMDDWDATFSTPYTAGTYAPPPVLAGSFVAQDGAAAVNTTSVPYYPYQ